MSPKYAFRLATILCVLGLPLVAGCGDDRTGPSGPGLTGAGRGPAGAARGGTIDGSTGTGTSAPTGSGAPDQGSR